MVKRDGLTGSVTKFLTPEEVAEILRINVITVYGYIQRDNLNAVRLGRKYRISREDLDTFIKSKRINTTPLEKNNLQKNASH
jgi:excisionase family DNA binding protein